MVEMELGELVHAVAVPSPASRSKLITIVSSYGRDGDPRLGEHHPVIFEVVADLEHRRVLEQRLQSFQHQRVGQLARRVGQQVAADVADGDVAGLVGRGRQADPDQPGDDAIDAVGLGIDRDIARGAAPRRSSGRAPASSVDRLIGRAVDGDLFDLAAPRARRHRRRHDVIDAAAAAAPPGRRSPPPPSSRASSVLNPWSSRNARSGSGGMPFSSRSSSGSGSGCVAHQPHQLAAQPRRVGMVDQVLLELGLGDLVGAGQHGLEVAKLLDQLARGLGADPRDAGHIVDAVAHQRQHVADLLGPAPRTSRPHRRGRCGGRSSCRACRPARPRPAASDPCRELTIVIFQPCRLAALT